jgi:hypothetical protein
MRPVVRRLVLLLYAAFGPPLLYVLYLFNRVHLGGSLSPSVEDAMLVALIASGGICLLMGLPGIRWIRILLALVYLALWMVVTLLVGLTYECNHGNCL